MSAMIPISSAKVTKFSPTHTSHVITSLIFLNDKKTLRASFKLKISFEQAYDSIITFSIF